jgi:homoserine dehydrogenase
LNDALKQAQALGYAESNPSLDVDGYDAKYKLLILLLHAFGIAESPERIYNLGIQRLNSLDLRLAGEKGYKIKLIAHAHKFGENKVIAFVLPQFVNESSRFFAVDDVLNGVQTETGFADKQFFMGKGAGAFPTASAVLSDISALSYSYRYEYKKRNQQVLTLTDRFSLEVFVSFRNRDDVPASDFMEVTEKYRSPEGNYIVGRINFTKLTESAWIRNPEVSVLLTPDFQPLPLPEDQTVAD